MRPVRGGLVSGIRGPSTVTAGAFSQRLAELTAEPVAESDELRNQALRRRLTRRLLEDPVMYYDELDNDERAYLLSQRHAITPRTPYPPRLTPQIPPHAIPTLYPP